MPKAMALRALLAMSNLRLVRGVKGSARTPIKSAAAPTGTPSANSHGHERTARIALAMAGPAAADTAMTTAVIPIP